MHLPRYCLSLALMSLAFTVRAESLAHSTGEAVLNAFIATYAKEEVSWKKDIHIGATPGHLEPGRQLGQSARLGYYSFLPKLWADLPPMEQRRVLHDPRLRAFLISSRTASTFVTGKSRAPTFPIEGPRVAASVHAESAQPNGDSSTAGYQTPATETSSSPKASAPNVQGSERAPLVIKVDAASVLQGDPLKVKVP